MEPIESNFQDIYTDYQPRILRYLKGLIGEEEAEDLSQEVFVKAHQALGRFRGEAKISTWLYRIATNAARDRIRSASFRQRVLESSLNEPDEIAGTDIWSGIEIATPENQVMRQEMYNCFGKFVEKLPVTYRTVFVLSELEGLANDEIAEVMGASLETVKIRLHRARERLFKELKDNCKAEE